MKLRIDPDRIKKLRMEFASLDDEAILEELINSYHEKRGLQDDYSALLEEKMDLELGLEEATNSLRRLRKEKEAAEKSRDNLRRRYRKLRSKYECVDSAPTVVEKVVYHEDSSTIDALRGKCNRLKELLWEQQSREEELKAHLVRLGELEARYEDWNRQYHGIIVRAKNRKALPDLELRIIDSKSYFEYRLDPERFEESHHVSGPYLVMELPYTD